MHHGHRRAGAALESQRGTKPRCKYGASCYRRSAGHFKKYTHPPGVGPRDPNVCRYGVECRRKSLEHWRKRQHPAGARPPPDVGSVDDASSASSEGDNDDHGGTRALTAPGRMWPTPTAAVVGRQQLQHPGTALQSRPHWEPATRLHTPAAVPTTRAHGTLHSAATPAVLLVAPAARQPFDSRPTALAAAAEWLPPRVPEVPVTAAAPSAAVTSTVKVTSTVGASQVMAPLRDSLLAADALAAKLPLLKYILDESQVLAKHMCSPGDALVEPDEALAIALYTYDLQSMSEQPSDNFYYVVNQALREKDTPLLAALEPFMHHLKRAFAKLPEVPTEGDSLLCYRGLPCDAIQRIANDYRSGTTVKWTGFTSVTRNQTVAQGFAGPGGVIIEVGVVSARCLEDHAAFAKESELILELPSDFVVVSPLGEPGPDGFRRLRLQQLRGGDTVVF